MQVREVMTQSAGLVDANTTIRDAAVKMRDGDLGALPVGDDGRLIGMVTDRDIVVRAVAADYPGFLTDGYRLTALGRNRCRERVRLPDEPLHFGRENARQDTCRWRTPSG